MKLEQLDLYEILDRMDEEQRQKELIPGILEKIKQWDPSLKVAAVYVPEKQMKLAEPSFAVLENGIYKCYEFLHGHILFRDSVLSYQKDLNRYWTIL